jgi:branched-chain amino acid transport system substrate-binding protein
MVRHKTFKHGVAFAALVAASSLLMTGASLAEVKFGALFPFSGQLALLGEESARGLEIAVNEINAKGGVQDEQVVLVRGDAVDNNQAIGEARRLISREGVKAIFGTYSSSRSIAASQVAELAGIPYFELGAVADDVTGRDFEYLFRTNPTAEDMAELIIAMIQESILPKLGKSPEDTKIAIIHEDSSYGTSVAAHQQRLAEKAGLNVVSTQPYPASTIDMSSLVLDLKQQDVDVVLQTSYQNDSVLFLRQAHEAGFKPDAIIGGGGGYSMQPTADAVGHDVIEGVLDVDFTQYEVNPDAAPGIQDFVKAYREKYGEAPRSGHSLNNYVGALTILQAIDKAEDFEPDTIRDAVAAIDIPEGQTAAGYGVKFGDTNQNERAKMMGMQWQGGKLVTVFPEAAAVAEMRLSK